jgi:hypothetical protein
MGKETAEFAKFDESNEGNSSSELEKFNAVLRKVLSVPREELLRREKQWRKEQARKKRARLLLASRASTSKD